MQDLFDFLLKRGILKDSTSNLKDFINSGKMISGYLGTDPTASSLHVGHLAALMLLKNFQNFGHKPFMLVGGATGMIGDPSFKKAERQFLSEDVLLHNQECIKKQLEKFLDFSPNLKNKAEIVNNMDWYKDIGIIDFLREAGKNITVNYMEAKESVKKRIVDGISFTEFSYQLLQAYDFFYLNSKYDVELQMGGADQWGNITTGIELVRRKTGKTVHGLTIPLLTKADGTKFGKSEGNNVWLDPNLTSPYDFYQFWINSPDEDAKKLISVFTTIPSDEIAELCALHEKNPEQRILQNTLARELTTLVHGEDLYKKSKITSDILFGNADLEYIKKLREEDFVRVCESLPMFEMSRESFEKDKNAYSVIGENLCEKVFSSKGELKRSIKENSVFVNKKKVDDMCGCDIDELLFEKYILVQRGSKKFYIIVVK